MCNHEVFNETCEFLITAQAAIKKGWSFSHDYGERKFETANLTATKRDQEGKIIHEVKISESYSPDQIIDEINKIEYPEVYGSYIFPT